MPTYASRDTSTGLIFENAVQMKKIGVELTKHKLYSFLKEQNVQWDEYISRKLLPDEAYFDRENNEVIIYEKKSQQTEGSADEKLQTCAFKILEYKKLFSAFHLNKISYIYVLSDWFKKPMYKDVLEYIKSVPGCDYIFASDIKN